MSAPTGGEMLSLVSCTHDLIPIPYSILMIACPVPIMGRKLNSDASLKIPNNYVSITGCLLPP